MHGFGSASARTKAGHSDFFAVIMKVSIVGAGFSGLTLAYFLVKRGVHVEVFEKENRVGGLLHTHRSEVGLIETAANGVWNTALCEQMFDDIGLTLAERKPE